MARNTGPRPAAGLVLVDKPQGLTSHDVVSRSRRAFGTRKIGHAGTLDPMATGLLLVGVEGATRLLTYLVGLGKTYTATIRLGETTTTDDADGEIVDRHDASDVTRAAIDAGITRLTGDIEQVPSSVSAIKVAGRRAYDLVRAGEEVTLSSRAVTIARFDVQGERRLTSDGVSVIDLDVIVDCSSGTYIRALARDLGADLGVGGHLTALRRTHVGTFSVDDAVGVDDLAEASPMDPADVASRVLGRLDMTADDARALRQGKRLVGQGPRLVAPFAAAVDDAGVLVGIVERRGADLKSAMNMPEEQP